MGMSMRSTFLLLLALVAVPLSTIKGLPKANNDFMQEGDKAKQQKILELLDQYVLHVDRGRLDDDHTEEIDLLDQYVMHVDRGADVELETGRKNSENSHKDWNLDMGQSADGNKHGPSKSMTHNSLELTGMRVNQRNMKTMSKNTGPFLNDREFGNTWMKLRPIDRVRRNLRGVQKTDNKNKGLVKPQKRMRTRHGIRARRSSRKVNIDLAEEIKLSDFTQEKNSIDEPARESKTGRRYKKSINEDNKQVEEELKKSDFRKKRGSEVGNRIDDTIDETIRDSTSGHWTHSVKLDDSVTLSWEVSNGDIEFLVEAATRGYVGVGFSPGGGMAGADIVLSWIDDNTGEIYVVDSHGLESNGAPVADPEQDCTLLSGHQNDSHTVVKFRRALETCDGDHDFILGGDTVRLIWATQDTDPTLDVGELVGMTWHGKENRGVRSLHMLTPPVMRGVPRGPQTQHWDVTLRNYEPVLQPGHERYVHHMLLYECVAPPQFASPDSMFQKYVEHPGESCYSPAMPQDWDQCMTAIVAWAVGSQGEFLPDHVGLPLADGDKAKYFMLEIHYDNPEFRKVRTKYLKRLKDSSGIKIHYTEDLREYDGGILVNGITITPLHIVPPFQPEYRTAGYCSSQCTERMFPQTGIKLVSVVLHSHLAGKKLRLRHIRAGRELPRVAEDDHYDFNYQQARVLPQEVAVLPGDELITECVYQTPNRTEPTFGGYSTKQEMCLAFVLYYPRTPLAACYSMTPVKYFFETFGVRQFYDVDMDTVERMFLKLPLPDNKQSSNRVSRSTTTTTTTTSTTPSFPTGPAGALDEEANQRAISVLKQMKDFTVEAADGGAVGSGGLFGELVISEPDEFRNKSFTSHLVELPWTEKLLTQRVEESFYAGKHMVFCRMHDDQLATPLSISTFPNFTELPVDKKNKSRCEGRIQHSLRIGNSSASSIYNTHNVAFLQLTIQAIIYVLRLQD